MNIHRITDKLGDFADAMAGWRPDAAMICGAALISYGAWMVFAPAGYIVGGLLLIAAGWVESRSAA